MLPQAHIQTLLLVRRPSERISESTDVVPTLPTWAQTAPLTSGNMIQFLNQIIKFSLLLFEGKSFTRTQSFQCVYTLHDKFTSEKCEIFHIVFSHCVWRPVLQMSIRRVKGFVFVLFLGLILLKWNFTTLQKPFFWLYGRKCVQWAILCTPLCTQTLIAMGTIGISSRLTTCDGKVYNPTSDLNTL